MGKRNSHRLIKEPFFFITQSFDYAFIDKNFLKNDGFGINESKLQSGYGKQWCMDFDGSLYDEESDSILDWQKFLGKKQFKPAQIAEFSKTQKEIIEKRKCNQLITSYYINEEGLFWDGHDLQTFPDRLYQKFAELKTDKEKSSFFKKHYFCAFFDASEVDSGPKKTLDHDLACLVPIESNTVRRLNCLGINREHETFANITLSSQEKKTTFNDLKYLEEIMQENIQDIYLDKEILEIFSKADPDNERPEYNFLKNISPEPLTNDTVKLKMIFGHFALCCLELYLEIKKELPEIRYCKNPKCGKQLPLFAHKNQKICKGNPKCLKEWKAQQKQIERENLKRRGKEKKKEKLKRRFI